MADERQLEAIAARLVQAEHDRRSLPSEGDASALSESAAYRVQELRLERGGSRTVGYKLGFTSAAMREQMSIPGANYGRLAASMELGEPLLDLAELIHPRIEPEIALYIDRDLDGSDVTLHDVSSSVRWMSAALEVVDSRYQGYRFTANENTADNSSAARFLLGHRRPVDSLEPRLIGVLLSLNGFAVGSGIGADAMTDPFLAVRWLSEQLAQRGTVLEAGSVVLTGGLTRAVAAGTNDCFLAEFAGLGTLSLNCSGTPAEAT